MQVLLGLLAPLLQLAVRLWDEKGKEIVAYLTGRRAQKAADTIATLETTVETQANVAKARQDLPRRSQSQFGDWLRRGSPPEPR